MALSKEQFMRLRRKGLSVEQIVSFESSEKPAGVETREEKIARFRQEEAGFRQQAEQQGSFGGLIRGTFNPFNLARATAKVVAETPAKFLKSAIEAPETILRGGGKPTITRGITERIPLIGKIKTFQQEARERTERIVEGKASLISAISPFITVPLAGIETLFLGTVAVKGAKALKALRAKGEVKKIAKDIFSPITKKEKIAALQKAGKPGGVTQKGITKRFVFEPSEKDIAAAKIVKGTVLSKSSPIQNITRINKRIENVSVGVESFLKTAKINPKITKASLIKSLDNIKPSLTTKTDVTLNRTFNEVKRVVKEATLKAGDNSFELWRARIKLDKLMEGEFSKIFGNPERYTSTKDAYLQMRRAINKFIETRAVGGGTGFTKGMNELSTLYESSLRLAEKNYQLLNTNAFQRFFKMHPIARKAAWFGVAGAAGGAGALITR